MSTEELMQLWVDPEVRWTKPARFLGFALLLSAWFRRVMLERKFFAFLYVAVVAFVLGIWMASGCASLSSYEQQHPDVARKAALGLEVAQCVDQAVAAYQKDTTPDAGPQ